jgi:hypothetical protein
VEGWKKENKLKQVPYHITMHKQIITQNESDVQVTMHRDKFL